MHTCSAGKLCWRSRLSLVIRTLSIFLDTAHQTLMLGAQALFVADYHCNIWRHMAPFFQARYSVSLILYTTCSLHISKIPAPSFYVPVGPVYAVACVNEFLYRILNQVGIKFLPTLTTFTVRATSQDYFFSCNKAIDLLNFHPAMPFASIARGIIRFSSLFFILRSHIILPS